MMPAVAGAQETGRGYSVAYWPIQARETEMDYYFCVQSPLEGPVEKLESHDLRKLEETPWQGQ